MLSHVSDKVYLEPGTGKEEDEEREQETSFEERKVPIFRFFLSPGVSAEYIEIERKWIRRRNTSQKGLENEIHPTVILRKNL